jgi:hypothetical protein
VHGGPRLRTALLLLLAAALLGACSRGVPVTVPGRGSDPVCVKAGSAWPASVSGRESIATDPAGPAVHAWGDPAIVARCGVATPGPTTDDCVTVNGVDWVATPLSDGTRFVTYGRDPAIEVLIPKSDVPEGSLLPVFTAVAQSLPETGRHCS